MKLKKAKISQKQAILELLKENLLPHDDLDLNDLQFFVVEEEGALIACAGIEDYGSEVLLRSVSIHPERQRTGLGTAIVQNLLQELEGKTIYLLTETAEGFFEKFGFKKIDKDAAPEVIRETSEFSYVCPDTAVCMKKIN